MNKHSLSLQMAQITGLSKREAESAVNAFCKAVTKELASGGEVRLINFGTFIVSKTKPRNAYNPHTREVIHLPAHSVVRFIPGKKIKDSVCEKLHPDAQA